VLIEFSPPTVNVPGNLSPAERDVARRLVEGERLPEIARARKTSPHTVANQLRSIYQKLGVSDRAELVRVCRAMIRVAGGHSGSV
jgi:DNA-binding CsgD family transcriptional regulator